MIGAKGKRRLVGRTRLVAPQFDRRVWLAGGEGCRLKDVGQRDNGRSGGRGGAPTTSSMVTARRRRGWSERGVREGSDTPP